MSPSSFGAFLRFSFFGFAAAAVEACAPHEIKKVGQLLRDGAPVAPRPRSRVRDEREQR